MSRRMSCIVAVILGLAVAGLASLVGQPQVLTAAGQTARPDFALPRGLHSLTITIPSDNAMTTGRIALGKQLFFDTRLSRTKKMSCETCHVPEKGWTDGLALSPHPAVEVEPRCDDERYEHDRDQRHRLTGIN